MTSILGKRKAPSSSSSSAAAAAQIGKSLSKNSGKKSAGAVTTATATATPSLKKRKKSLETARKPASATKKTKAKSNKASEEQEEEEEEEEVDESLLSAQEIFRRHFEAQFKPIGEPGRKKGKKTAKAKAAAVEDSGSDGDGDSSSDSDDGDVEIGEGSDEDVFEDEGADGQEGEGEDWSGLSDEDEDDSGSDEEEEDDYEDDKSPVIEVVDHTNSKPQAVASMSKRELKAFMSSKPPSQTDPNPSAAPAAPADPDDENDKSMLANDLALQRLLSESHLLSRHTITPFSNPTAASKTFSEGKLRQRQTDLRTQALARGVSGVSSLFIQEKMPMAFRKGMVAVAANKEAKRRQQARENGIVLEREAPSARGKKVKKAGRRGERGVDGPEVGRMRGAELRLSERDVQNIEASGGGRGGRAGRGGRGGGRGRGRR